MLLIPGLSALFTFVYLRPQEVFEVLRPVTLAWMLTVVALGWLLDVRLGASRPRASSLLVLATVLFGYCLITVGVKAPERLIKQIVAVLPSLIAFVLISQGVQSLRALGIAAGVLLTLTLVVSVIAVDQGLASPICYVYGQVAEAPGREVADGRPCNTPSDCREGGEADKEYLCEKPGMFNTHSVAKRVRFRGLLEDPNELSWIISMAFPFAFAFYERQRSRWRLAILAVTLVIGTTAVVMSQSRSGQLSVAAVLGVYFVRRFGWRGAALAAIVSLPVIVFGGRTGADAESSSVERLECWSEALSLWRENPLLGVGQGQFTEHHYLTAHNSFLLTVAELGPLGLFLWSAAIYRAFKITIRAQLDLAGQPEARPAAIWAAALMSSLVGMLVSTFFLSIAYHTILWMFLGLVGSLEAAMRLHRPGWKVRFGAGDLAIIALTDVGVVGMIAVYLRLKGV